MPIDLTAVINKLSLYRSDPQFIDWIYGIPSEDLYLRDKLGGDYKYYDEMLSDTQIAGKLDERVGALLGRAVKIDAASSRPSDKAAAETCQRIIDRNLIPYEWICRSFLYSALIHGFSVMAVDKVEEITDFGREDGEKDLKLIIPKLQFVEQRRFIFTYHEPDKRDVYLAGHQEGYPTEKELDTENDIVIVNGYELRLLTRRSPVQGERCRKGQFFVFTYGSLKGLPTGYGLGGRIRKFYQIRQEVLRSGVLAGDRLGMPPTHGIYPEHLDENDPDQALVIASFKRLIQAIAPNAHAVTTAGFEINFPEASQIGGKDLLQWLYETASLEITRAIWGEGSYAEKETGSYAADQSQSQNRNENIVDSDCNQLDEQIRALWEWIRDKNFPKANVPIIRRETYSEQRELEQKTAKEDLRSKIVATDRTLILDIGLEVTDEYIKETYGEAFSLPKQEEIPAEPEPTEEPIPDGVTPPELSEASFGAVIDRVLKWNGLDIGVEYLPGQVRFKNKKKLRSGYGHLRGFSDGKSLDCYLCSSLLHPEPKGSQRMWQITQLKPSGEFDEFKFMLGYSSANHARNAYLQEMPKEFYGGIKEVRASDLERYKKSVLPQFSEPAYEQDLAIADSYEDRMVKDLSSAYESALTPIQSFIERIANSDKSDAEKYREFMDGIFDLYSEMDPGAIASVLGEGLAASYMAGMYSERVDRDG